jgi:hypothetical protein
MKSWVWQVAFATIFGFLVCYMINVPGTGAFVGEFGGSGFRVLHFGCGQGWLIRRLFEVRTLFILVCLLRRLRSLSYPCTVQSSLFRLLFRSWQCSLPGGFPCRQTF